jgi:hypothetical protein
MARHSVQPESGRILRWPAPWGGEIRVEVQQIDEDTWRADERFRRPEWHVIAGRREGELVACQLRLLRR